MRQTDSNTSRHRFVQRRCVCAAGTGSLVESPRWADSSMPGTPSLSRRFFRSEARSHTHTRTRTRTAPRVGYLVQKKKKKKDLFSGEGAASAVAVSRPWGVNVVSPSHFPPPALFNCACPQSAASASGTARRRLTPVAASSVLPSATRRQIEECKSNTEGVVYEPPSLSVEDKFFLFFPFFWSAFVSFFLLLRKKWRTSSGSDVAVLICIVHTLTNGSTPGQQPEKTFCAPTGTVRPSSSVPVERCGCHVR